MLNFCDFILVYVFTTNHHLNEIFQFCYPAFLYPLSISEVLIGLYQFDFCIIF